MTSPLDKALEDLEISSTSLFTAYIFSMLGMKLAGQWHETDSVGLLLFFIKVAGRQ